MHRGRPLDTVSFLDLRFPFGLAFQTLFLFILAPFKRFSSSTIEGPCFALSTFSKEIDLKTRISDLRA